MSFRGGRPAWDVHRHPLLIPLPEKILKKMAEKLEKKTPKEESKEKQDFRKLMDAYKLQNPVKFELKKEALEKQLNALE